MFFNYIFPRRILKILSGPFVDTKKGKYIFSIFFSHHFANCNCISFATKNVFAGFSMQNAVKCMHDYVDCLHSAVFSKRNSNNEKNLLSNPTIYECRYCTFYSHNKHNTNDFFLKIFSSLAQDRLRVHCAIFP